MFIPFTTTVDSENVIMWLLLIKLKAEQEWTECYEFCSFSEAYYEMQKSRHQNSLLFSSRDSNKNYLVTTKSLIKRRREVGPFYRD